MTVAAAARLATSWLATLAVIGLLSVAGASAQSQPPPLLTFAEMGPLAVSWDDLANGVAVELLNDAPRQLTVAFTVTALRGKEQRLPGNDYLAVELAAPPAKVTRGALRVNVPPGDSVGVLIKRVASASLPSGTYSSSLVAHDTKGTALARLTLTITGRAAAGPGASGEPAEPLTDTLTINAYRHRWLLGWLDDQFDSDWLEERYPAPADAVLPLTAAEGAVALPDQPVGVLRSGTRVVAVGYLESCPHALAGDDSKLCSHESGHLALPLDLKGLVEPGSYEGKLDLLPENDEVGAVALTVVYSDFVWVPLLVLTLGVLTGFWIGRQIGVAIPYERLRGLLRSVRDDYQRTHDAFRRKAKPGWREYDIAAPLAEALTKHEQAIEQLHQTYTSKIPESKLNELATKIEKERQRVDDFSVFGVELGALEAKVVELETDRPPHVPSLGDIPGPDAARELRESLLKGERFTMFKAFEDRRAEVQAAPKLVKEWQELEEDIGEAQQQLSEAKGKDEKKLKALAKELGDLYSELWRQTSVEAAEVADFDKRLSELRTRINASTREQAAPEPKPDKKREPTRGGLGTMLERERGAERTRRASRSTTSETAHRRSRQRRRMSSLGVAIVWLIKKDLELSERAEHALDSYVERRLGGWRTLALLVLALVVAIVTGLSSEYAGKAFGASYWDYAKLFLWGLATKVVLDTVVNGLDAIGVLRFLPGQTRP